MDTERKYSLFRCLGNILESPFVYCKYMRETESFELRVYAYTNAWPINMYGKSSIIF